MPCKNTMHCRDRKGATWHIPDRTTHYAVEESENPNCIEERECIVLLHTLISNHTIQMGMQKIIFCTVAIGRGRRGTFLLAQPIMQLRRVKIQIAYPPSSHSFSMVYMDVRLEMFR
jgi:hypothetical protein